MYVTITVTAIRGHVISLYIADFGHYAGLGTYGLASAKPCIVAKVSDIQADYVPSACSELVSTCEGNELAQAKGHVVRLTSSSSTSDIMCRIRNKCVNPVSLNARHLEDALCNWSLTHSHGNVPELSSPQILENPLHQLKIWESRIV